jgi:hypothetical protein
MVNIIYFLNSDILLKKEKSKFFSFFIDVCNTLFFIEIKKRKSSSSSCGMYKAEVDL